MTVYSIMLLFICLFCTQILKIVLHFLQTRNVIKGFSNLDTIFLSLEPVVLLKNLIWPANVISEMGYICEMYFSSNFWIFQLFLNKKQENSLKFQNLRFNQYLLYSKNGKIKINMLYYWKRFYFNKIVILKIQVLLVKRF